MTAPGHAYGVGVVDDHCTGRFIWMMPSRSMMILVVVTVMNDENYKDEYGFHGKDAWFHS